MTDENTPVDTDVDLETFEAEFFGKTSAVEQDEPEVQEEIEEEAPIEAEDDSLATDDDDEDEAEDEDEDEDSDEEEEPEPVKAKPKNKTQKRIEQLLERERLANERAVALERRLSELEAANKEVNEEPVKADTSAPNPDALDDKGEPLYPLGEFDPQFIRDLTRYTIGEETKAAKAAAEREAQEKAAVALQQQISAQWAEKIEKAEEETPDIREKIQGLTVAFQGIDPTYGDYLATTIMTMDAGPAVMYYLSQNIGEAQKIVASGPAAATLALGRLEARLSKTAEVEEKKRNKRVSDAPAPPEARTRGAHGRFAVAPDTDDQDAFERAFFS